MLPSILLGLPIAARLRERLATTYEVHGPFSPVTPEGVPEAARKARVLVTIGGNRTDKAMMDALPELGMIACYGTGFEGVDMAEAARRGIIVTHAKDANATSVAEFAMGLVIAASRDMGKGERALRAGKWRSLDSLGLVPGLAGNRMGVYGLGSIGAKIASRAAAFEMEVGYHGRGPKAGVPYVYHPTLKGMAEWCDVLVVAVRASAETRHAVNAEVLAALGRKGVVVNIARGSVIDEAALIEALEQGVIHGAGLDVFEHEPAVPERLLAVPNAVLTPHIAAFTTLAQRVQQKLVEESLAAFFAGETPANLVAA
ncbi:2-hydroxyacid dehydrogenase [Roseomonas sp. HJA6]|uniref:2-hydroxyacid dehydrogenase n=1 Tax=Roseomonas alba TaxID=2846776 RepID=A0ABS7A533_9PROT|nr:2-hydroxyacid dehydrogenase [Neoroseomonas alba]MBW6396842.1 2-hydroxyacid dehydrogenase [Neoroseomonas alba]